MISAYPETGNCRGGISVGYESPFYGGAENDSWGDTSVRGAFAGTGKYWVGGVSMALRMYVHFHIYVWRCFEPGSIQEFVDPTAWCSPSRLHALGRCIVFASKLDVFRCVQLKTDGVLTMWR